MKTGLVFSDSHNNNDKIAEALDNNPGFDFLIHLGDGVTSALKLIKSRTDKPIYAVRGNNDFSGELPLEEAIELEGARLLLMHGHSRSVKNGLLNAVMAAKEAQCGVLLFGHTHAPQVSEYSTVRCFNPGSCHPGWRPSPTFLKLTLQNGEVNGTIKLCSERG